MRIGTLDRKISIEEKTQAIDPVYGTQTDTWSPVAENIWANIQEVLPSKSEKVAQQINIASRPKRIRIRYRPGLTSAMRVRILSPINSELDIICQIVAGPAELGRREGLELMVEEYSI